MIDLYAQWSLQETKTAVDLMDWVSATHALMTGHKIIAFVITK